MALMASRVKLPWAAPSASVSMRMPSTRFARLTFEPAIKDGKPVPVLLNLVVEFRIYSNRTGVTANPTQQPPESSLPGPYSVQRPQ